MEKKKLAEKLDSVLKTGLEYIVELSADDYIEIGTKVEDTDATYTINSCDGTEVTSNESVIIIELLP